MKIAQLTTDAREHHGDYDKPHPYFGAAPEALLQGFAHLPEVEIHVVSCTRRPMRSPQKLADNIWFHSLLVPKLGWGRTLYSGCIRATRRALRDIQPDLVHGQGTERDCAIAAALSGFPNVITLHGIMSEVAASLNARPGSFHWMARWLESFALRRTRGVFCNSQHTEDFVRPRGKQTWRVPNAVREAVFTQPIVVTPASRCVMLNVGVVCEYKRQLELLAVLRRLIVAGHKFEFHFYGHANPENAYARAFLEQIKAPDLRDVVVHKGFKELGGLVDAYDGARGMVHVPNVESFGLVVAEGLARNLKFFGARTGGVPDIAAGVDGAELFAADDWNGLQEAIARWIQAGYPRAQTAAATMRARYAPEVVARRHLEIYREVLSSRS